MNAAGRRLFDEFLAEEGPEARRLWHELTGIAGECGVDLEDLSGALQTADRPLYDHAVVVLDGLAALGSLGRILDLCRLAEAVDAVDAEPEVQSLILAPIDRSLN